jgi:parvulin-like peptidyl-prolyl isomerase
MRLSLKVTQRAFSVLLVGLMVATFGLAGCGEDNKGLLNTNKGGETVITVDGKIVTKNEYDKAFEQTAKQMGLDNQPQLADNPIFKEIIKQQTVQQLIALAVIDQAIDKQEIVVTNEELDAKRQEVLDSVGGQSGLLAIMKQNGMTEDDFDYQLKQMKRIEKLMYSLDLVDDTIPEADVAEYYKAHEVEFDMPKQIASKHILIKAIPAKMRADIQAQNKDITPEELEKQVNAAVEAKKAEAQKLLDEAKKNPENFGALAARHSEDTMSQVKNGDVGFMQQRSTDPSYWSALEKGTAGEIYPELVKSAFGFHVINVGKGEAAKKKTLDEVKGDIEQALKSQKRAAAFSKWLDAKVDTLKKENMLVISKGYGPQSMAGLEEKGKANGVTVKEGDAPAEKAVAPATEKKS